LTLINFHKGDSAMTKFIDAIKKLTAPAPQDDDALRRRIRQLETENRELREKLLYRGPWMF
jgi:cytochrome c556